LKGLDRHGAASATANGHTPRLGARPIPIDDDHIQIAKPVDRASVMYMRSRDFVSENARQREYGAGCKAFQLPKIEYDQPWNIIPKLLRVALLVLVCTIGFKGIQALIAPPVPVINERTEQEIHEIRALTQQLVANSVVKAAPGAEKAVREAVAAAAKGAAEGDERLQKALDLLKANKVAEAEVLFRDVAADKAVRIKQDRKDAAAAYRNLGAIAGLGDPKRALGSAGDLAGKGMPVKTDRKGARSIAQLMRLGWFRPVHCRSLPAQEVRAL
jgi:hypothetical protein